mmetsp:Transcript_44091/g.92028  ORF Transcript_44091/g.92028 Transcript_44091/m.92028 type:complete len:88 (+) Transcript_44091:193-456(+)
MSTYLRRSQLILDGADVKCGHFEIGMVRRKLCHTPLVDLQADVPFDHDNQRILNSENASRLTELDLIPSGSKSDPSRRISENYFRKI